MGNKLDIVFFDAGGTLVGADDIFDTIISATKLPQNAKLELLKEFIAQKNNANSFQTVKALLSEVTSNIAHKYKIKADRSIIAALYSKVYTETVHLFPQVKETLDFLKKNKVQVVLVSDADADVLIPQFSQLGINQYFEDMVISSQIRSYKPSEQTITYIRKHYDTGSKRSLFIGDSIDDILTAKAIGADSVFIGRDCEQSTFRIGKFSELLPLLKKEYHFEGDAAY